MAPSEEPSGPAVEFDPDDINQDGEVDFRDAAIRAELEVGHPDDTVRQAWYHALLRIGRMAFGFTLLIAGLAMMVLPGPGAVVTAAGLATLARDVKWADRALRYLRKKAPGIDEEGPIPRSTIAISVLLMAAAGFALYWWSSGGEDTVRSWF